MIRHPNGFVSAYANNGELDVKLGELVKRGQVIAKSGQERQRQLRRSCTSNFRKGTTPVDPTAHTLLGSESSGEFSRIVQASVWIGRPTPIIPRDMS